ncbi:MAG TPA: hypothetical protein VMR45_05665 [Patescibacteria group bacterium]|nr:hypothetical protein [Patescibacteria group bacterium]
MDKQLVSHNNEHKHIWFRLLVAYVIILQVILGIIIVNSLSNRGNLNKDQAEKIARLEAITRCLNLQNDNIICRNLDLFSSRINDPGIVSREGIFTYNFSYSVGEGSNYFQVNVSIDKKGHIQYDGKY